MTYDPVKDPLTDQIWKRQEPESPCVKVCVMHPETGLCIGCLRTMDEIAGWKAMGRTERHRVLDALPGRAPLVAHRRGGRAARLRDAAE